MIVAFIGVLRIMITSGRQAAAYTTEDYRMFATMIENMKKRIIQNNAALESLTSTGIPSQAYIVATPDCTIAYDFTAVEGNGLMIKVSPVCTGLDTAPRFSHKEALQRAQFCKDNRDNVVIAVLLTEALILNTASIENTIAVMEAATK